MLGPLSFLRISKCQNENKGWGCVISINELRDQQNKKSYSFNQNMIEILKILKNSKVQAFWGIRLIYSNSARKMEGKTFNQLL